jgi:precorrin-6A/cobalt-precorrin-6A reductase
MKLLLLGGTADARRLATQLHQQGMSVVYSIAGLVRIPSIDCEIVVGGFTQFGGLSTYIKDNNIAAILDVTHPYAQNMSAQAVISAKNCEIPCWRFHRPAWVKQDGDCWFEFSDWPSLLSALKNKSSVFFTAGQLMPEQLNILKTYQHWQQQILRTAVKPKHELPNKMQWIKAIGPFTQDAENDLLDQYSIDALVSKNSGGDATSAKLTAARLRSVPVYMLARPTLLAAEKEFNEISACEHFVSQWFKYKSEKSNER